MSWIAVGIAAVGAVSSMQQAKRQQEARESKNMAEAAQTRYSPWTHMEAGKIDNTPGQSGLEAGLSGGIKGYMTGSSISNGLSKTGVDSISGDAAKGALGGGDMSNKLGAQGAAFESSMGQASQGPAVASLQQPDFGASYGQQDPNQMPTLMGNKPRYKTY